MHLSQVIGVLAEETGASTGRFKMLARRLQDDNQMPRKTGGSNRPVVHVEDVVRLILAHLSAVEYHEVADTVARLVDYRHDGMRALDVLASVLRTAFAPAKSGPVDLDQVDAMKFAMATSLSVVNSPDRPAVVIRQGCVDGAEEFSFTADGAEWKPHLSEYESDAHTMPGLVIFRIGQKLRKLMRRDIEYATVPFTVTA